MPQKRLSFLERNLPRIRPALSFWRDGFSKSRVENRHKEKADNHSKSKEAKGEKQSTRRWKAYLMTGFISLLFIAAFGIPLGIAIASWQKGGYDNFKVALWWGMTAYVMLGVGLFFSYYYYVIGPAAIATPEHERAYMGLSSTSIFYFERGQQATVLLTFKNGGKTPASEVWMDTHAIIDRPEVQPKWINETPTDPAPKAPGKTYVVAGDIGLQRIELPPQATREWFDLINNGLLKFTIYGKVYYKDITGKPHCLQWCRFFKPGHDTLTVCPDYNRELY